MMTDADVLESFPSITQEDLDDLRSGETAWQQAADTEGDLYAVWYDEETCAFLAAIA